MSVKHPWTSYRKCLSCGKTRTSKPLDTCTQPKHFANYTQMVSLARSWEMRNWRFHQYGLRVEEYDAFLAKQGFKCAICGNPCENFKRSLSVDHNHDTGKNRGLLGLRCNAGVGVVE